eukprot:CAMPEP_0198572030 /NCGR_PEP_ID=MMETSP1462-20131121/111298_1 /TAXON_ID=1333877 /ORGANISM="Brandtodinium nutriculum, Strain RCC3387" /LENGTH=99 /DNA_ID=CAMNT_0044303179 /DNA_START=1 /DNA_END=296 /DNA_ORIENTATION=-
MDQTFVYIVTVAEGWALSHGSVAFTMAQAIWNAYAIFRLWHYARVEARHWRFIRMGIGLFANKLPVLLDGDWWLWLRFSFISVIGGALFALDPILAGWG